MPKFLKVNCDPNCHTNHLTDFSLIHPVRVKNAWEGSEIGADFVILRQYLVSKKIFY
jgi:hypothetical protein